MWKCLTVSRKKKSDSRTKIDYKTIRLYLVFGEKEEHETYLCV